MVAFGEAFDPVFAYVHDTLGFSLTDKRLITLPSMGLLTLLMVTKGANVGVKALYGVVTVLLVSLLCFFLVAQSLPQTRRAIRSWQLCPTLIPFSWSLRFVSRLSPE